MSADAGGKKRILVIGPSNIGDGILIADVVARVRDRFPEAYLALVVGQRASVVFDGDPRIQALLDTDSNDSPWGRIKLAAKLWRYQPHILVDLRSTLYPLLLKPFVIWRYLLKPPTSMLHMRARHLWKLKAQVPGIGRAAAGHLGAIGWSPKDAAAVEALKRRWGLGPGSCFAVFCPGARSHIKRWTAEGFARVADRLIQEAQVQVIFSGEPEEKPIIEEIQQQMARRSYTAVGLATIRQLAALMSQASLVITNDSASLHLASAVGAPTVAVFGPTDPDKYGPTAPLNRVVRRQLFCSPCEAALCRFSHECMRFISADEVFAAASQLLEAKGGKHEPGKRKPKINS